MMGVNVAEIMEKRVSFFEAGAAKLMVQAAGMLLKYVLPLKVPIMNAYSNWLLLKKFPATNHFWINPNPPKSPTLKPKEKVTIAFQLEIKHLHFSEVCGF